MKHITSKEALRFFNENGYLVINSMRGSGKTNVLRDIIESNRHKKIGILCPSLRHYDNHFHEYRNCNYIVKHYSNGLGDTMFRGTSYRFDIILGDEIYVEPSKAVKTACVMTRRHVEYSLYPDRKIIDSLDELKHNLPSHDFEIDFGQFL